MAAPSQPLPARVIEALRRGDTTEAIQLLRATTRLDLKAAKDVIDAYRRGDGAAPAPSPAVKPQSASAAHARHLVEQTAVVQRIRNASGFGLAQAHDVLETSRFRDRPHGVGGRSPGEMPRSGSALRWIVVVGLAAYLLYSFLGRVIHV